MAKASLKFHHHACRILIRFNSVAKLPTLLRWFWHKRKFDLEFVILDMKIKFLISECQIMTSKDYDDGKEI